jgi:adenylosuccinate synthase
MPAIIVIGAQWGDEGKGKIVDHLAERTSMVVRYQGGNNAGHTVVIGNTVLKLHQVPAGITRPQVAAVLGNGMVINPLALVEELDKLEEKGIDTHNLHISANAHVIMPYHLILDDLEEKMRGQYAIGTTKRGIGPAYTDKVARCGIRIQELISPLSFAASLERQLGRVNVELVKIFGHKPLLAADIIAQYQPAARRLAPFVTDTSLLINKALGRGEQIMLEGAQATMLDIDFGTYPYVTSSSPSAGGACQGSGISPLAIKEILGIVKVYTSRVGKGPFPTELTDATGDWIVEHGNEYGTTTGRRRRCGWIDLVGLRYAQRINGFSGIALTRLDILTGMDEIKLCVAYRLPDGSVVQELPMQTALLEHAEPVYETMPGWHEPISTARSLEELPVNARSYCQRVAELLQVPIYMISVGAERNDLVALHWPIP